MPGTEAQLERDPAVGPRETRFEPSDHRFKVELGDGRRATLPPHFIDGQACPPEHLTFEVRQQTIAETARCFRLARRGDNTLDTAMLELQLIRSALRKIGANDTLSDHDIDSWLRDIGPQGAKYVDELVSRLTGTNKLMSDMFTASYRPDRASRRHGYTVPQLCIPAKRWAARTLVNARWNPKVAAEGDSKGHDAHWSIDGAPVDFPTENRIERDLSFVMTELTVAQENGASDLVDDPDDMHAVRIVMVMLSIVEIGRRSLGNSPEDMEYKLCWLEDIGPRGRLLVTGVYAKLHEVDRVELSRFLDSSEALD